MFLSMISLGISKSFAYCNNAASAEFATGFGDPPFLTLREKEICYSIDKLHYNPEVDTW
jgi:hypothetical protein